MKTAVFALLVVFAQASHAAAPLNVIQAIGLVEKFEQNLVTENDARFKRTKIEVARAMLKSAKEGRDEEFLQPEKDFVEDPGTISRVEESPSRFIIFTKVATPGRDDMEDADISVRKYSVDRVTGHVDQLRLDMSVCRYAERDPDDDADRTIDNGMTVYDLGQNPQDMCEQTNSLISTEPFDVRKAVRGLTNVSAETKALMAKRALDIDASSKRVELAARQRARAEIQKDLQGRFENPKNQFVKTKTGATCVNFLGDLDQAIVRFIGRTPHVDEQGTICKVGQTYTSYMHLYCPTRISYLGYAKKVDAAKKTMQADCEAYYGRHPILNAGLRMTLRSAQSFCSGALARYTPRATKDPSEFMADALAILSMADGWRTSGSSTNMIGDDDSNFSNHPFRESEKMWSQRAGSMANEDIEISQTARFNCTVEEPEY